MIFRCFFVRTLQVRIRKKRLISSNNWVLAIKPGPSKTCWDTEQIELLQLDATNPKGKRVAFTEYLPKDFAERETTPVCCCVQKAIDNK